MKKQIKTKIGGVVKTRENLEKMRVTMMKNYPMKKYIKGGDLLAGTGMVGSTITWLVELGAIKDMSEPGTTMRDGKLWKWVYDNTDNGVVDSVLVNSLIDKKRNYERNYREQRREGTIQIIKDTLHSEGGITKLPTTRHDKLEQVKTWFEEQLKKHEQVGDYLRPATVVGDYLRPATVVMYERVIEMLTGLNDLAMAMKKINI